MYKIHYSTNFKNSLSQTISYWKNQLKLSDENITKYVSLIYKNISILKSFPYISENASNIYHFSQPTYRITIGKKYAIFYQVDEQNKIIEIGNLFSNRQMKIEF